MICLNVGDVLGTYNYAEISCAYSGNVVRKLTRLTDGIEIDYITGKVVVPAFTELRYEPWVLDRGSMLFDIEGHPGAKFCGEFDVIHYPDGKQETVQPA
jgi:hypothetical protein